MPKCYLTIDDSPSPYTDRMCDFLSERNIPALLFVRGDMTDKYGTDALLRALGKGFHLANHAYSHTHYQKLSFQDLVGEIERVEKIIERLYAEAGIERPGKYFRFPHLDRGTGGYVVDYDAFDDRYRDFVTRLFTDGVRLELKEPTLEERAKKAEMQAYLKAEGFEQPFANITYPWFKGTEMEKAADCMYTYSTSDWMILDRYRGQFKFKSVEDLKDKIDNDVYLNKDGSHSVILIHDKPEPEFPAIFESLVDHMVIKGYDFLPIP